MEQYTESVMAQLSTTVVLTGDFESWNWYEAQSFHKSGVYEACS